MKFFRNIMVLWLICMLTVACSSSYASEGTSFMWELLKSETASEFAYGETAVLGDALIFRVPSDWEQSEIADAEETCFVYEGVDAEGRVIFFFGVQTDSETLGVHFSSYTDMKNKLIQAKSSFIISSLQGIDMIFTGDDEFMGGMCLSKDGVVSLFAFQSEDNKLSEIKESEKLCGDITAVLHSVTAMNSDTLMCFDDNIWDVNEEAKEAEPEVSEGEKTSQNTFFDGVISGNEIKPESHPIYLDERLVVYIPDDWEDMSGDSICSFQGADDEGHQVSVIIDLVNTEGMTDEELESQTLERIMSRTIISSGLRYNIAFGEKTIMTTWKGYDGIVYRITANLESEACKQSDKLIADLHEIFCRLRLVRYGEVEQAKMKSKLAEIDHTGEKPVKFKDAEFERMLRVALERSEEEPVYSSELEMIQTLIIRCGKLSFSYNILGYEPYDQPGVLDLADLQMFPNLTYLEITDMKCVGYEVLPKLIDLRVLMLTSAGLSDCSFLKGMTLSELDLAGNEIGDFTPIAEVNGLSKLNVVNTGIETLEKLEKLDLKELYIGGNPVSDLSPITRMINLEQLSISGTKIQSLEACRNFHKLKGIDISSLENSIALEPLYELPQLQEILVFRTKLSVEDCEKFKDILFGIIIE